MLTLTAEMIRNIAQMNGIQVTNHWYATSQGNDAPILSRMSLIFTREAPEALHVLTTTPKEVAISISGICELPVPNAVKAPVVVSFERRPAAVFIGQTEPEFAHA